MADQIDYYVTIRKGSEHVGGRLWWWTVRTPEQQAAHDADQGFSNVARNCTMTKWGATSAAKRWIKNAHAQDRVQYLEGPLAEKEQEKIDKEFQKLQRKLAKEHKSGVR